MPGLDTSQLTDDQLFRKYHYLLYMLNVEGIKTLKIKGMGGE